MAAILSIPPHIHALLFDCNGMLATDVRPWIEPQATAADNR